jgi:hypothetical protein
MGPNRHEPGNGRAQVTGEDGFRPRTLAALVGAPLLPGLPQLVLVDRERRPDLAQVAHESAHRGGEVLELALCLAGRRRGLASWSNEAVAAWEPASPVLLRQANLRSLGAAQDDFELVLVESACSSATEASSLLPAVRPVEDLEAARVDCAARRCRYGSSVGFCFGSGCSTTSRIRCRDAGVSPSSRAKASTLAWLGFPIASVTYMATTDGSIAYACHHAATGSFHSRFHSAASAGEGFSPVGHFGTGSVQPSAGRIVQSSGRFRRLSCSCGFDGLGSRVISRLVVFH